MWISVGEGLGIGVPTRTHTALLTPLLLRLLEGVVSGLRQEVILLEGA